MEWSNAKKFVIVLLVLLNVLLAGLNYKQNRENTMTAAQGVPSLRCFRETASPCIPTF